jgi:hypothetical protein
MLRANPPQDGFAVANRDIVPGFKDPKNSSVESVIHLRHNFDWSLGLKRASALVYSATAYLGDAPGSVETAPLARTRDSLSKGEGRVSVGFVVAP